MSYILEALKKSEHARQQGRTPDLATLPMGDAVDRARPATARLPWLASGALLLALAVAGWWRPWLAPATTAASSPAAAVRASSDGGAAALPALAGASPVADSVVAALPVAAPVAVMPPAQSPSPSPAHAQPPAHQPSAQSVPMQVLPALAPRPDEPAAVPASAQATPAVAARPVATPASTLPAPPSRVLAFYELPSAVRERIPALAISGFSYTEEPGMRLAVINDRVLRQGESAAPGITLEQIASDGVVLNFNGYRFRPQR